MIPPFHSAVDRAISYLDPKVGLLGVADFFVPSKYDLPLRQMTWLRRFFWRCAHPSSCPTVFAALLLFCPLAPTCMTGILMGYIGFLRVSSDFCSCRATFDTDNIDIGPERRNYLDHRLSRVWEMNSEVCPCTTLTAPTCLLRHVILPITLLCGPIRGVSDGCTYAGLHPLRAIPARPLLRVGGARAPAFDCAG